jgi:RimJ/RimL family protein N-acetyltransferase
MDNWVDNTVLRLNGIRLEPLGLQHTAGLQTAAADGALWRLRVTSVPEPEHTAAYIETALHTANRLAFAVIDEASGQVLGSTSYHDILPAVRRLEIGYTWYAQSHWRTALNSICKLMLLRHAFETLQAQTVGWRTDIENIRSQAAIERLGARKDGTIRGNALRRDGSIRDTVMYSMSAAEWPQAKQALLARLQTI